MSAPQKPAAAAQRAQVARSLKAAQQRATQAHKPREGEMPLSPKLVAPSFRGQRSVLLYLDGIGVAIPAGSKVAIGKRPQSAVVLDAEKLVHALTVQDGRVMEIAGLPQTYLDDLRRRAFP